MRRLIIGFIGGLTFASAGVGVAATTGMISSHGATCASGRAGIACVKTDGSGYGVGISDLAVIVTNENDRVIFKRVQPGN